MADGSVVFSAELDTDSLKKSIAGLGGTGSGSLLNSLGGSLSFSKIGAMIGKTIGAEIVISIAKAVGKTGIAFDTAMSQVAATMGTTVANIEPLKELAEISGRTTQFTAVQAAEALNYMALAGWDTETILEGFPHMLSLAAAGAMDLAYASDIVTDGITALGLTTADTETFVDQMAKTASKSNTSVSQLGEGILTVGATARILEGGTTELNTVLGLLADNGIKASEGGTQLRNIIMALSSPIQKAADTMDAYGLSAYDAEGNFRPLFDIFSDINNITAEMNAEDKTWFLDQIFNRYDMKSANALLATSAERWTELNDAVAGSKGSAFKMAQTQLDNLGGDITIFNSAVEGLKLAVYRPFEGVARSATQFATGFVTGLTKDVEFITSLPETYKNAVDYVSEGIQAENEKLLEQYKLASLMYGDPASAILYGAGVQQPQVSPDDYGPNLLEALIPSAGAEGMSDIESQFQTAAENIAAMSDKALVEAFKNGEISYDQLVAAKFGEGATGEGNGEESAIKQMAKTLVSDLATGVEENSAILSATIGVVLVAAKSSVDTSQFKGVGYQITAGMAAGVRSGSGILSAAVTSVINAALAAARKAADINSPSRLFRDEIGLSIAEGTAKGVTMGAGQLRTAVANMVNTSIPDMSRVSSQIMSASAGRNASAAMAAAMGAANFSQTNNFNVPVQTPDEFAKTMRLYATYGLQG